MKLQSRFLKVHRIIVAFPLLAILILACLSSMSSLKAQEHCRLPTRLIPNMPGRVRAVSTAGNNLRASAGLTGEISAQLANDTEFIVQSVATCVDGMNWYQITTLAGIVGWTAEGVNDLYWLEPTPFCTTQQRAANIHYELTAAASPMFDELAIIDYVPARKALLLGSDTNLPEDPAFWHHPALLTYHWFDLNAQTLIPTTYPDADLITPALTDRLGITKFVFGERSYTDSLHLSPRRDHILYFVDNPLIEQCAEGCSTAEVWVANANGTNAVDVGTISSYNFAGLTWGSNGHIYLNMIYLDASRGIIDICEDGSCFTYPFPTNYAYPSVSPDGKYISFVYFANDFSSGQNVLFQRDKSVYITLPATRWWASAIWSDDGKSFYYFRVDDQQLSIATTSLADLNQSIIVAKNIESDNLPIWDIASDIGMAFVRQYDGLSIYCV